jgi:hypothetical protein
VFTFRERGTTSTIKQPLLDKEKWIEVAMLDLVEEYDYQVIDIGAIEVELLLPEAKERIKQKALLDEKYLEICRSLEKGELKNEHYSMEDELLCWKKRIYVPEKL